MALENQIEEIKENFPTCEIETYLEGGCRFLHLSSFIKDPENKDKSLDCLFACDTHMGYESRLWFPKKITTKEQRHWNHPNTYILGKSWHAFSFKAKGNTLLEKLMSHMGGIK